MMWIKWRVGWKNPIDYNDLQKRGSLLWSWWRDLNPHSTLNPILKLSFVNSTTSDSKFTFV